MFDAFDVGPPLMRARCVASTTAVICIYAACGQIGAAAE